MKIESSLILIQFLINRKYEEELTMYTLSKSERGLLSQPGRVLRVVANPFSSVVVPVFIISHYSNHSELETNHFGRKKLNHRQPSR